MRGDPPLSEYRRITPHWSTPHARGSTFFTSIQQTYEGVYPACAGIHQQYIVPRYRIARLPRMRGDPPLHFHVYSSLM